MGRVVRTYGLRYILDGGGLVYVERVLLRAERLVSSRLKLGLNLWYR